MIEAAVTAFVTLFVIIDPIAVAPLFVALTRDMDAGQRRAAAIRACLVAAGVLTAFGLAGQALLDAIGISLPAFRVSGGILLFLIAVEMLFERRTPRRTRSATADPHAAKDAADDAADDPSIFPIAVPLIAGPGAMATMVLLAAQDARWGWLVAIHAMMALVVAFTGLLLVAGTRIAQLLGPNGINVATRLFGILLAALAVQIVLDGLGVYGLRAR